MRRALSFFLTGLVSLGLLPGASCAAEQTFTNSVGMEFALIPASNHFVFRCGVPGCGLEKLLMSIPRPFYMGKHEVTQAQWQAVMGNNPSTHKGPNRPVNNVSWNDAQNFIRKLNEKEGHKRYRLPTEAEWEYADRAGRGAEYCQKRDNPMTDKNHAWFGESLTSGSRPVGQKEANPWGLHDMTGNVNEWVQDSDVDSGAPEGLLRVQRGGHWFNPPGFCSPGYRSSGKASEGADFSGFRVVLALPK